MSLPFMNLMYELSEPSRLSDLDLTSPLRNPPSADLAGSFIYVPVSWGWGEPLNAYTRGKRRQELPTNPTGRQRDDFLLSAYAVLGGRPGHGVFQGRCRRAPEPVHGQVLHRVHEAPVHGEAAPAVRVLPRPVEHFHGDLLARGRVRPGRVPARAAGEDGRERRGGDGSPSADAGPEGPLSRLRDRSGDPPSGEGLRLQLRDLGADGPGGLRGPREDPHRNRSTPRRDPGDGGRSPRHGTERDRPHVLRARAPTHDLRRDRR